MKASTEARILLFAYLIIFISVELQHAKEVSVSFQQYYD